MKTLKDRIHMYIFLVTTIVLTGIFLQQSAYADLEICKFDPGFAYKSVYIQFAAGR